MLDSFKKGQPSQAAELQALVASSREERAALSTMLTPIQLQSSKLAAAGKSLQNVEELVDNATARLDGIVERLAALESRSLISCPSLTRNTRCVGSAVTLPLTEPAPRDAHHRRGVTCGRSCPLLNVT